MKSKITWLEVGLVFVSSAVMTYLWSLGYEAFAIFYLVVGVAAVNKKVDNL